LVLDCPNVIIEHKKNDKSKINLLMILNF